MLTGRVYDSRNRDGGGFGPGWSMPHEPSNIQTDFTYPPAKGWGEDVKGAPFTTYYLISSYRKVVVLRLGDGAVFKFKMDVNPKSSFMRPIMDYATPLTVSYEPVDTTKGTLEALEVDSEVFLYSFNGGTLADAGGNPAAGYNVYRKLGAEGVYVKINTAVVDETEFIDEGVILGSRYYYVVRSVDGDGTESVNSESVSIVPSAPATSLGGSGKSSSALVPCFISTAAGSSGLDQIIAALSIGAIAIMVILILWLNARGMWRGKYFHRSI